MNLGSIFDITGQLATGRIDVITTGFAHSGHQTRILKHLGKCLHTTGRGTQKSGGWKRVKRNQVELAAQALASVFLNKIDQLLGMLDVSTAVYNPRLDLFNACTHA